MDEPLKPCPFCGNVESVACFSGYEIEQTEEEDIESDPNSDCYAVVCDATKNGCGAIAGYALTREGAIAKWNRRASPAEESQRRCPVYAEQEALLYPGGYSSTPSEEAQDAEDARTAFERWADDKLSFETTISGLYLHDRTEISWQAWKAARASARPYGEPGECEKSYNNGYADGQKTARQMPSWETLAIEAERKIVNVTDEIRKLEEEICMRDRVAAQDRKRFVEARPMPDLTEDFETVRKELERLEKIATPYTAVVQMSVSSAKGSLDSIQKAMKEFTHG